MWVGGVAVADDGERGVVIEALEAAGVVVRDGPADVVVVDRAEAGREWPDACVVVVGAGSEAARLAAWDAGADAVVPAGAGVTEVAAQVRALLRRRVARVPRPRAGESRLEVDAGSRVARVDGAEVALTRTEFDLLLAMTGRPGQVWERDSLIEAVWGDRWATDRHVVEVHVGNLRRKLAAAGGGAWIRTVRGIGYRLDEPAPA